eukprot:CAMPEP_0174380026 /NCGR_PEP_ID=MMETSP0811_2-20130205/123101_1 /TAXON_ID=73025 ORGANISM="Eutreptiella gymnastica-like, Strain CCMP1594" /NCGR_SAMPLE_ID=MMETSP0811_2 /ASSEMBLY_ACC=CAM_ASM_000667 /LENGTH=103 /DNA_ID=CAMNT_0015532753 /DNA_START=1062 /DNA_END=1373 /DNA_ORIENTATION=-
MSRQRILGDPVREPVWGQAAVQSRGSLRATRAGNRQPGGASCAPVVPVTGHSTVSRQWGMVSKGVVPATMAPGTGASETMSSGPAAPTDHAPASRMHYAWIVA